MHIQDPYLYHPSTPLSLHLGPSRLIKPRPLNHSNPNRSSTDIFNSQNHQIQLIKHQLLSNIYSPRSHHIDPISSRPNNKSFTTGIQTAEIIDPEASRKDKEKFSTMESRKTVNQMEMKMRFVMTENSRLLEIQRGMNKEIARLKEVVKEKGESVYQKEKIIRRFLMEKTEFVEGEGTSPQDQLEEELLNSALTISSLKSQIQKHIEIQYILKQRVHTLQKKSQLPSPILGKQKIYQDMIITQRKQLQQVQQRTRKLKYEIHKIDVLKQENMTLREELEELKNTQQDNRLTSTRELIEREKEVEEYRNQQMQVMIDELIEKVSVRTGELKEMEVKYYETMKEKDEVIRVKEVQIQKIRGILVEMERRRKQDSQVLEMMDGKISEFEQMRRVDIQKLQAKLKNIVEENRTLSVKNSQLNDNLSQNLIQFQAIQKLNQQIKQMLELQKLSHKSKLEQVNIKQIELRDIQEINGKIQKENEQLRKRKKELKINLEVELQEKRGLGEIKDKLEKEIEYLEVEFNKIKEVLERKERKNKDGIEKEKQRIEQLIKINKENEVIITELKDKVKLSRERVEEKQKQNKQIKLEVERTENEKNLMLEKYNLVEKNKNQLELELQNSQLQIVNVREISAEELRKSIQEFELKIQTMISQQDAVEIQYKNQIDLLSLSSSEFSEKANALSLQSAEARKENERLTIELQTLRDQNQRIVQEKTDFELRSTNQSAILTTSMGMLEVSVSELTIKVTALESENRGLSEELSLVKATKTEVELELQNSQLQIVNVREISAEELRKSIQEFELKIQTMISQQDAVEIQYKNQIDLLSLSSSEFSEKANALSLQSAEARKENERLTIELQTLRDQNQRIVQEKTDFELRSTNQSAILTTSMGMLEVSVSELTIKVTALESENRGLSEELSLVKATKTEVELELQNSQLQIVNVREISAEELRKSIQEFELKIQTMISQQDAVEIQYKNQIDLLSLSSSEFSEKANALSLQSAEARKENERLTIELQTLRDQNQRIVQEKTDFELRSTNQSAILTTSMGMLEVSVSELTIKVTALESENRGLSEELSLVKATKTEVELELQNSQLQIVNVREISAEELRKSIQEFELKIQTMISQQDAVEIQYKNQIDLLSLSSSEFSEKANALSLQSAEARKENERLTIELQTLRDQNQRIVQEKTDFELRSTNQSAILTTSMGMLEVSVSELTIKVTALESENRGLSEELSLVKATKTEVELELQNSQLQIVNVREISAEELRKSIQEFELKIQTMISQQDAVEIQYKNQIDLLSLSSSEFSEKANALSLQSAEARKENERLTIELQTLRDQNQRIVQEKTDFELRSTNQSAILTTSMGMLEVSVSELTIKVTALESENRGLSEELSLVKATKTEVELELQNSQLQIVNVREISAEELRKSIQEFELKIQTMISQQDAVEIQYKNQIDLLSLSSSEFSEKANALSLQSAEARKENERLTIELQTLRDQNQRIVQEKTDFELRSTNQSAILTTSMGMLEVSVSELTIKVTALESENRGLSEELSLVKATKTEVELELQNSQLQIVNVREISAEELRKSIQEFELKIQTMISQQDAVEIQYKNQIDLLSLSSSEFSEKANALSLQSAEARKENERLTIELQTLRDQNQRIVQEKTDFELRSTNQSAILTTSMGMLEVSVSELTIKVTALESENRGLSEELSLVKATKTEVELELQNSQLQIVNVREISAEELRKSIQEFELKIQTMISQQDAVEIQYKNQIDLLSLSSSEFSEKANALSLQSAEARKENERLTIELQTLRDQNQRIVQEKTDFELRSTNQSAILTTSMGMLEVSVSELTIKVTALESENRGLSEELSLVKATKTEVELELQNSQLQIVNVREISAEELRKSIQEFELKIQTMISQQDAVEIQYKNQIDLLSLSSSEFSEKANALSLQSAEARKENERLTIELQTLRDQNQRIVQEKTDFELRSTNQSAILTTSMGMLEVSVSELTIKVTALESENRGLSEELSLVKATKTEVELELQNSQLQIVNVREISAEELRKSIQEFELKIQTMISQQDAVEIQYKNQIDLLSLSSSEFSEKANALSLQSAEARKENERLTIELQTLRDQNQRIVQEKTDFELRSTNQSAILTTSMGMLEVSVSELTIKVTALESENRGLSEELSLVKATKTEVELELQNSQLQIVNVREISAEELRKSIQEFELKIQTMISQQDAVEIQYKNQIDLLSLSSSEFSEKANALSLQSAEARKENERLTIELQTLRDQNQRIVQEKTDFELRSTNQSAILTTSMGMLEVSVSELTIKVTALESENRGLSEELSLVKATKTEVELELQNSQLQIVNVREISSSELAILRSSYQKTLQIKTDLELNHQRLISSHQSVVLSLSETIKQLQSSNNIFLQQTIHRQSQLLTLNQSLLKLSSQLQILNSNALIFETKIVTLQSSILTLTVQLNSKTVMLESTQETNKQLKSTLSILQSNIINYQNTIESTRVSHLEQTNKYHEHIFSLQQQIETYKSFIQQKESQIAQKTVEIEEKQKESDILKMEYNTLKKQLQQIVSQDLIEQNIQEIKIEQLTFQKKINNAVSTLIQLYHCQQSNQQIRQYISQALIDEGLAAQVYEIKRKPQDRSHDKRSSFIQHIERQQQFGSVTRTEIVEIVRSHILTYPDLARSIIDFLCDAASSESLTLKTQNFVKFCEILRDFITGIQKKLTKLENSLTEYLNAANYIFQYNQNEIQVASDPSKSFRASDEESFKDQNFKFNKSLHIKGMRSSAITPIKPYGNQSLEESGRSSINQDNQDNQDNQGNYLFKQSTEKNQRSKSARDEKQKGSDESEKDQKEEKKRSIISPDFVPSGTESEGQSEKDKSEQQRSQGSIDCQNYAKLLAQKTKGAHMKLSKNPYNKRKK